MDRKQLNLNADYDVPIQKPFDELPEWLASTLQSRFTTKKFPKKKDAGRTHSESGRAAASEKKNDH